MGFYITKDFWDNTSYEDHSCIINFNYLRSMFKNDNSRFSKIEEILKLLDLNVRIYNNAVIKEICI